jgi:hypothetical protein
MTETHNLTDEERAEQAQPVFEAPDEDASPGDLSGGPLDVPNGVIEDDSGFREDVEAYDHEPDASSAGDDAP